MFAFTGVGVAEITGDARWDGAGSMAVGTLLFVVAVVLGLEMKSLLIGEGAEPGILEAIETGLVDGHRITRVIHLRTLYLGPDSLLVAGKVALAPGLDIAAVAQAIDDAEVRVRVAVPVATTIFLEPDLYRPSVTG